MERGAGPAAAAKGGASHLGELRMSERSWGQGGGGPATVSRAWERGLLSVCVRQCVAAREPRGTGKQG